MRDSIACWSGIIAAVLLALNLKHSGYAYFLFLLSSWLWIEHGLKVNNSSIVVMNAFFLLINFIGVLRWIIFP